MIIREGSMGMDFTVKYLVFAQWKLTSNIHQGLLIGMCFWVLTCTQPEGLPLNEGFFWGNLDGFEQGR